MKKIAFIKIGNFSLVNDKVVEVLQDCFPGHSVEVFDVREWVRPRSLPNLACALKEYGLKILWHNWDTASWRTSYFFQTIKTKASQQIHPDEYFFSFQTQSVFDASVPGLAHFVYTDATHASVASQRAASPEKFGWGLILRWILEEALVKKNSRWFYTVKERITGLIIKQAALTTETLGREKQVYHNAALVFTMSTDVNDSVVEDYACFPDKAACAYKGVPVNLTYSASEIPPQRINKEILFVGYDWDRKGGVELIQAFEEVLDKHPGASLVIVGGSPKINMRNCRVMGPVPPHQMRDHYHAATVFCLPTLLDPCASVLIEAALCRLPIITSNIGSTRDIVHPGQNGYLIDPGDIEGLAAALTELLDDPEKCRQFGEQSQRIALERYTWENTGRIIKKHIEKILTAGCLK